MRLTLLATWVLCVHGAAFGSDPDASALAATEAVEHDVTRLTMPWSNDLHSTLPLRAGGGFAAHIVPGRTMMQFVGFSAGGPLYAAANGRWSLGLQVLGRVSALQVPSEGRGVVEPPTLLGELWFMFAGPRRLSFHSVGLNGGGPLGAQTMFWTDERDTQGSGGFDYAGYLHGGVVDTDFRVSVGPASYSGLHAEFGGGPIVKIGRSVAVPLGLWAATAGAFGPEELSVVATVGLHVRPGEGLEIGLDATVPLHPLFQLDHESPIWPTISLRTWDARRGASAAPLWSRRLRGGR